MRRIMISFPEHYFSQLQANAAHKKLPLAAYLRELVDIGHHVEEATAQQLAPSNHTKHHAGLNADNLKELWKNVLLCAVESRYLTRYLVDSLADQPTAKRDAVRKGLKEKTQTVVAVLLQDK